MPSCTPARTEKEKPFGTQPGCARFHPHGLAYQEMAERTGLNKHTITRIARELGLERTEEQLRDIRSRRRKELIQKERRRIIFGLDQRTNIKVVSNNQKIRLRGSLKRIGIPVFAAIPSKRPTARHSGSLFCHCRQRARRKRRIIQHLRPCRPMGRLSTKPIR